VIVALRGARGKENPVASQAALPPGSGESKPALAHSNMSGSPSATIVTL
jgi:hypothetical protein